MPDFKLVSIALLAILLAWKSYQSFELKADKVQLERVNAELSEVARRNAAAAAQADKDRKTVVDALEEAQAEIDANTSSSQKALSELDRALPSDDGPIAPVLERLRVSRFGGQP